MKFRKNMTQHVLRHTPAGSRIAIWSSVAIFTTPCNML
jgi:hypothetical protein